MNARKTSAAAFLALLATLAWAQKNPCPPGSSEKTLTLTAGQADQFKLPTEPTSRRPELDGRYERWIDFDETRTIAPLGHSFQLAQIPCNMLSGSLRFSAMPLGKAGLQATIALGFDGKTFLVTRSLSELSGGRWSAGSATSFTLDLAQLGLLELIRQTGVLDVQFLDASVDQMQLDLVYCEFTDCNHNCVPDAEDIAKGTSKDLNRNGIPDECEQLLPGLVCPGTIVVIAGNDCCGTVTLTPTVTGVEGEYRLVNNIDPKQLGTLVWCFPLGSTTVTFTLEGTGGAPITCVTTVIVIDRRGPIIMPVLQ